MRRWEGRCALTGVSIGAVLRASHMKPWVEATDEERLDPENGLLLAANADALFDRYLISFTQTERCGGMTVSPMMIYKSLACRAGFDWLSPS